MNSSEIKKANCQALPKFLLVVAVAAVFGGVVGFFCARYGLHVFSARIKTACLLCLSVAAFVAILVEGVIIQQKCVDAARKTNPEKTVSVYDLRFQKKWLESCDEAEKQVAMRSAFRAYNATNTVCMILAVVLALCALVFNAGFLPSLVACVVWLVNQTAYCRETIRLSRAGNQISL